MKRLLLILSISLYSLQLMSQTANVVLFTENGEKFYAIINGIRQNDISETNVKITGLNAEYYKLKVIFEDKTLGEENFNLALQFGNECSYSIKKNSKKQYVMRFISAVPIAEVQSSSITQQQVVYSNHPAPVSTGTVTQQSTTTISTTKSGSSNPDDVNFNMGINVGEQGGNININMSGVDQSNSSTTTTHSTTTTTTTTTTSIPLHEQPTPPPSYIDGYNGPFGCPVPMAAGNFNEFKQTLKTKTFEDTKMTIAKQVIANQCLISSQVKEIMQLFSFEESKLDFAKFAYDHTYDIGNYFKVNDAFTFETSIEDLNDYIKSK